MLSLIPWRHTTTESYDTLLKRAKLTTLQNRRLQDILILLFKVKNSEPNCGYFLYQRGEY